MIKIVITEDDFRIADIHEELLRSVDGVEVVGKALNGEQTLSLIKEHHPDLLLLDIYLPDYLGTDLIREVRNIYSDIDIIIVTAAKETKFLESSLRQGVVNYLIKPVTLESFKKAINDYKEQKMVLSKTDSVDQELIDTLFHSTKNKQPKNAELPKGIDPITLTKITTALKNKNKSWSAEEMGKEIGSSRTTARRYLEYLVSVNEIQVEQEYGIIGRPERRYRFIG